jgi:mevalonate kinase
MFIQASAPGKIILFGEHAVVYGRPAIAAPVSSIRATATVTPAAPGSGLLLELPDIGERVPVTGASTHMPLAMVAMLALQALGRDATPDWTVTVRSTIPVASGLGSGAAAATAIVRALAAAARVTLLPDQVSALVYESETLFHGTPSGVDNTVIAYGLPVWFVRGEPPQPFAIARPLSVVIGDTGIPSPTSITVGDVRRGWQAEPARFEALFDAVDQVAQAARRSIENGAVAPLGPLMDQNHSLLQEMGVSSSELDRLCQAARRAGAWGAKLSGGGRGGNMVALVQPDAAEQVIEALLRAGAARAFSTSIGS